LERFFGILIEHYAGSFPLWLSPEQIRILPITEKLHKVAVETRDKLRLIGIICDADLRAEKLGAKIRDARNARIPYIAVLGEKEIESGTLSVRTRREGELGQIPIDALIEKMQKEITAKE
jgi:threonyl-tRNA synthetase